MPKATGIGARLYFDGFDVSGDVGSVQSLAKTQELDNVTGLDKPAMERLGLLLDGEISFNCFFNPDTTVDAEGVHEIVKVITGPAQIVYLHRAELGTPAAAMVSYQATYNLERSDSGALRGTVQALSGTGFGLEWGVSLTLGAQASTGAGNLTGVDNGVASLNGWAAYLQVINFTGTSITATLQQSSDNGGADAYAAIAGGAFAAVPADPATQRIEGTGALEQWVRVALTGTFSQATIVVVLVRK